MPIASCCVLSDISPGDQLAEGLENRLGFTKGRKK